MSVGQAALRNRIDPDNLVEALNKAVAENESKTK